MANHPNDKRPQANATPAPVDPTVVERVQELTWALLDGQINDDETALLDSLLLGSSEARDAYRRCVEMHVELQSHFASKGPQAAKPTAPGSPILGFLHAAMPPITLDSTPASE